MITTLVLYIVLNGKMEVSKLKTSGPETCAHLAEQFKATGTYAHVECISKTQKAKAKKTAE